jgi:sterol desaturase/sphingolipid hydroxylase (fatty acid hydroxylase superfamily)
MPFHEEDVVIAEGDPLVMFAQAFVGQAAGYFAVVGLLYAIFWRWGRARFRKHRIPQKPRLDGAQLRREVTYTLGTLLVGAGNAALVSWLFASGHTALTMDGEGWGPLRAVATLAALLVVNEVWFYTWHRLLHHPRLFRFIHAVHHKSVDVNPFSSYAFHPLEGLLLGVWIIPCALFVPLYVPLLGVLQGLGLANNVLSHLGYELYPRALLRVPVLRWLNTSTFHSLHHTRLRGNYGLMSRVLDRWLGTELPDYEAQFLARGEPVEPAAER